MTGYTHEMVSKNMDFPTFALSCARAFGALIMMRDDPSDAPIPDAFEPSDCYQKWADAAAAEVAKLQTMNDVQRIDFGRAMKDQEITSCQNSIEEHRANIEKLTAMLAQVQKWQPPTEDHRGLKDFMIQQLADSIDSEDPKYSEERLAAVQAKTPQQFFDDALKTAIESIPRSQQEQAKEIKRTNDRNKWVRDLRNSLKR